MHNINLKVSEKKIVVLINYENYFSQRGNGHYHYGSDDAANVNCPDSNCRIWTVSRMSIGIKLSIRFLLF